jgi:hypothetical protein
VRESRVSSHEGLLLVGREGPGVGCRHDTDRVSADPRNPASTGEKLVVEEAEDADLLGLFQQLGMELKAKVPAKPAASKTR